MVSFSNLFPNCGEQIKITIQDVLIGFWKLELAKERHSRVSEKVGVAMRDIVFGQESVNPIFDPGLEFYQTGSVSKQFALVAGRSIRDIGTW